MIYKSLTLFAASLLISGSLQAKKDYPYETSCPGDAFELAVVGDKHLTFIGIMEVEEKSGSEYGKKFSIVGGPFFFTSKNHPDGMSKKELEALLMKFPSSTYEKDGCSFRLPPGVTVETSDKTLSNAITLTSEFLEKHCLVRNKYGGDEFECNAMPE